MFCLPNLVDLIVIGVVVPDIEKSILGCQVYHVRGYVDDFYYEHSS
jgi:hypothetical protein